MAVIGRDSFASIDQSNWPNWTHAAGTSTLAIASNEGTVTGVLNANDVMTLGPNTQANTDIVFRTKITDTNIVPGAVFRCDSAGTTYYRIKNNAGLLGCTRVNAGTPTTVGTAVSATFNANTFYWIHARIVDNTITANWWADGSSEPAGWMFSAVDTAPIATAGKFGIYTNNSGAVPTATNYFDTFTATDTLGTADSRFIPRAFGGTLTRQFIPGFIRGTIIKYQPPETNTAFIPRAFGGTLVRKFTPRVLGGTIARYFNPKRPTAILGRAGVAGQRTRSILGRVRITFPYINNTFIPRVFGGTLFRQYIPRAFGSTVIRYYNRVGITYYANPGDNLVAKCSVLLPGDTLILNDGVYQTTAGNHGLRFSNLHGTYLQPITIKAANDGMAILDGMAGANGNYEPILVSDSAWVTIQGIVAQNSYGSVVYLDGSGNGIDHITLQRITAHDAGAGNYHIFDIESKNVTNVLLEDCAGWGQGRYIFTVYHARGSNTVTFRRCYAYWQSETAFTGAPRATFNIYGAQNVIVENCIGRNCVPTAPGSTDYFTAVYQTSDDTVNFPTDNAQYLGCIFYDNWEGFWLNNTGGSNTLWKDCYFETPLNTSGYTSQNQGDAFYINGNSNAQTIQNCTFRSSVVGFNRGGSLGSVSIINSMFVSDTTGITNDPGHTYSGFFDDTSTGTTLVGTDLIVNPNYDILTYGKGAALYISNNSPYKNAGLDNNAYGSGIYGQSSYVGTPNTVDIGANILYQYKDGTLTTTPLWPWPMETRVMRELGQSPTYNTNGGPWASLNTIYSGGIEQTQFIPRSFGGTLWRHFSPRSLGSTVVRYNVSAPIHTLMLIGRVYVAAQHALSSLGRAFVTASHTLSSLGRVGITGQQTRSIAGRTGLYTTVNSQFIPRVFGGTLVAQWIPRVFGGTIVRYYNPKRTIAAVGRLFVSAQHTLPVLGRIFLSANHSLKALGRVCISAQHTLSSLGRVFVSGQHTLSVLGRVGISVSNITNSQFIPRIFGGTLVAQWIPRIFGGTIVRYYNPKRALSAIGRVFVSAQHTLSQLGRAFVSASHQWPIVGRIGLSAQHTLKSLGRVLIAAKTTLKTVGRVCITAQRQWPIMGRVGLTAGHTLSALGRANVKYPYSINSHFVPRTFGGTLVRYFTPRVFGGTIISYIPALPGTRHIPLLSTLGRIFVAAQRTSSILGRAFMGVVHTPTLTALGRTFVSAHRSLIPLARAFIVSLQTRKILGRVFLAAKRQLTALGRSFISVRHLRSIIGRASLKAPHTISFLGRVKFGQIVPPKIVLGRANVYVFHGIDGMMMAEGSTGVHGYVPRMFGGVVLPSTVIYTQRMAAETKMLQVQAEDAGFQRSQDEVP